MRKRRRRGRTRHRTAAPLSPSRARQQSSRGSGEPTTPQRKVAAHVVPLAAARPSGLSQTEPRQTLCGAGKRRRRIGKRWSGGESWLRSSRHVCRRGGERGGSRTSEAREAFHCHDGYELYLRHIRSDFRIYISMKNMHYPLTLPTGVTSLACRGRVLLIASGRLSHRASRSAMHTQSLLICESLSAHLTSKLCRAGSWAGPTGYRRPRWAAFRGGSSMSSAAPDLSQP